jgi:CheY-like chemotaxis protein
VGEEDRQAEDGRLVLVVEDDSGVRQVLVETLTGEMGLAVVAVEDGDAALAALASPNPALVLTDIRMPGPSGVDLLVRIRADERTRAVPVVAMTALGAADEERQSVLEAGCLAVLEKPFDLDDLIATVTAALRGEVPPPQARQRRRG